MHGKITGYFLIAFLLLNPSSAFLADKCNIDLDLTNFFNQGKVDTEYVLQGAAIFADFFQENSDFVQKFPSTNEFVNQLVQHGTRVITATNLAYIGASIYLGAVVLTSYCYIIHSRKQLAEVHSIDNKLKLIIKQEVSPILQSIETLLNGSAENGLKNASDAKINAMTMLKERIIKIQNIRNDIKVLRGHSIEGEEQTKILQWGTVGTFTIAVLLVPHTLGVSSIIGIASAWGYCQFERSKLTYRQALKLLDKIEDKAIAAEKALTMLNTRVEIAYLLGFKNPA